MAWVLKCHGLLKFALLQVICLPRLDQFDWHAKKSEKGKKKLRPEDSTANLQSVYAVRQPFISKFGGLNFFANLKVHFEGLLENPDHDGK